MKTGFVLEGGGMRGMYTAGVLDVFMEKGIRADGIIGVSAGALVGVNYPSAQPGRMLRYNLKYAGDKHYMGMYSLLTTGNIVNKKFAYYTVPQTMDVFDDKTFMESGIPFYAVVTNMETGQAEYLQVKSVFEDMEILRASSSMPFVSHPVIINGQKYLDGGIVDSIPYQKFLDMGYERVIVVLTRDTHYVKEPMSKRLISLCYHKYPALEEQLIHRHEHYNNSVKELVELEKSGRVILIRPSEPITIKRLEKDPDQLRKVYDLGIKDAKAMMETLLSHF